jgi:hypothetical protein
LGKRGAKVEIKGEFGKLMWKEKERVARIGVVYR